MVSFPALGCSMGFPEPVQSSGSVQNKGFHLRVVLLQILFVLQGNTECASACNTAGGTIGHTAALKACNCFQESIVLVLECILHPSKGGKGSVQIFQKPGVVVQRLPIGLKRFHLKSILFLFSEEYTGTIPENREGCQ